MTSLKQENSVNILQLVTMGLLVVAAFFIGMLWTKVQNLEGAKIGGNVANTAGTAPTAPSAPTAPTAPTAAKDLEPISAEDHVKGNRNARYALVEYSDYECPFCKRFHPTGQKAFEEYGKDLMWVFRHFPLDSIHPNARPMALGAECVAKLGGDEKFWQFTDVLMGATGVLNATQMAQEAQKLGVNTAAFNNCFTKNETADIVESDYQSGIKAGVTGTPGNILLDTKTGKTILIPGAVPYESLKQSIESFME